MFRFYLPALDQIIKSRKTPHALEMSADPPVLAFTAITRKTDGLPAIHHVMTIGAGMIIQSRDQKQLS